MTLEELKDKHSIYQDVECGVYVGEGWVPLLDIFARMVELHKKVYPNSPDVLVGQVKEKFGGLRIYLDQADDFIHGAAAFATSIASYICEDCGKPGKARDGGWIRTLCDKCEIEQDKKRNS